MAGLAIRQDPRREGLRRGLLGGGDRASGGPDPLRAGELQALPVELGRGVRRQQGRHQPMGRHLRRADRDLDLVAPQRDLLLEAGRRRRTASAGRPRRGTDRRRDQRRAPWHAHHAALGSALRQPPHARSTGLGGAPRGRVRDDPEPRPGGPPAPLLRAAAGAFSGRGERAADPERLRGRPLLFELLPGRPGRVRTPAGPVGEPGDGRARDRLRDLPLQQAAASSRSARSGASGEWRKNTYTSRRSASAASRRIHGASSSSE